MLYRAVRLLITCVAAVACGLFTITMFGAQDYTWNGITVRLRVAPAWHGETRLALTPLGEIRARTHKAPILLTAALHQVSLTQLQAVLRSPPQPARLEAELRSRSLAALRLFGLRQILFAGLGGLVAPLVLRTRRARVYIYCALTPAVVVAVLLLRAADNYNVKAFAQPQLTGSLGQARWALAFVHQAFVKADTLSARLRNVADNLGVLYGRIDELPSFQTDLAAVHILHISDVHNNASAVAFVRELALHTPIDMVINTGDLTDLGLPVEATLSHGFAYLRVPYVYVAGNHDSLATVAIVRRDPRAVVLNGTVTTVHGINLLGAPDPAALRQGPGSVDTPLAALSAAADDLAAKYRAAVPTPDIVCVHNPRQAAALMGTAPLILCGHMHRMYILRQGTTVLCNAGSTGAAGVRYLDSNHGEPFTAEIVALSAPPKPHLLYVDQVSLSGKFDEYSIVRHLFAARRKLVAVAGPHGAATPASR